MPPLYELPLSEEQQVILQTLFEEGGLNTRLIATYVLPGQTQRQLAKVLEALRARELIASQALGAAQGSEYCWFLTYAGARALGRRVAHGTACYRAPSREQLAQKGLILALVATLQTLNWQYVRPQPYNAARPKPAETPQRQVLYQAVAAHFARTVPAAGVPRLHPTQVPAGLNDWVAWPAGQEERAVVVIVHPLGGSPRFWRQRHPPRRGGVRQEERLGRTHLYRELARIVPVLGLFATPELLRDYTPLLAGTPIRPVTGEELPGLLHEYRRNGGWGSRANR
jgi:hypothetical protein